MSPLLLIRNMHIFQVSYNSDFLISNALGHEADLQIMGDYSPLKVPPRYLTHAFKNP